MDIRPIRLALVTSTEAPAVHPDLEPGAANESEDALSEEAALPFGNPVGAPHEADEIALTPSEASAARDMAEAIARGRAKVGL